jgi:hypothetical protein
MHSTRFRRLWLIICLTLLGGLAMAVPVNCLCDADQHWGQAVHPLFQHHHGDGHDHRVSDSDSVSVVPTLSPDSTGAALVVSEHGSFMSAAIDGLLLGKANLWLALSLLPLLRLLPAARRRLAGVTIAPAIGPPRPRSLFS